MAESAQTLIRAKDETGPAWASAQQNAAAAISGIKGMIPGLATALSAAGFINMVKGSIDAMDHLNDLSKTTGLTVEALSGLKLAAKQSGGDLDSIAASVNKLAVEMGKAPAKFRELGITAQDPLEAFKQLADIFNRIEDPQQRAAVAAAALGKSWAGAAPLLAEGSQKIAEMVETGAKAAGVTSEMARQSDELNGKWLLLVGSGGLVNGMVGRMLPTLLLATDAMIALKNATGGWIEQLEKMPGLPALVNPHIVTGARLLMDARAAERSGMSLGSGPPGDRADRMPAPDVAGFLGTNKEALAAEMALQAKLDGYRKERLAIEEQENKRTIALRMKNLDDLRDAELQNARERMEVGRAIEAFNNEREAERVAQERRSIEARMRELDEGKAVADSLLSVTEQENLAYQQRLANLKMYLDSVNLSQVEANALLAQLQVEHEANLGSISAQGELARQAFSRMSMQNQAKTIFGELAGITAGVAQHNRALFEINKVSGIANAILNAYEGISLTLKSYPFPLNAAMAVAHGAAAFAQVSAIQSATFGGGGGSAPSIAGSTPATPVTPVSSGAAGGGPTTFVEIHSDPGGMFSEKTVRQLIERIAEVKGGRVVLG